MAKYRDPILDPAHPSLLPTIACLPTTYSYQHLLGPAGYSMKQLLAKWPVRIIIAKTKDAKMSA